jgi:alkylhydroperoxidase family enzyme
VSARIAPAVPPFSPLVAEQLARLMPPGTAPLALFTTVARDERLFRRLMGGNLLDRGALTLRQREIVVDRITARCGAEYEWGVHVAFFGKKVAFTDAELRSLVHGSADDACWTAADERALICLCDQLHETATIDDALWAEARGHFSETALIEILMLAGSYRMVSYLVNALRLPVEPFAARFPAAV